jgi:hypothetical protein
MSYKSLLIFLLGFLLVAGCSPGSLGNQPSLPPVNLEIRYFLPGAGEVFFVWGVNGWAPVPGELRPPGTTLKDNVMNTPMSKEGENFVVRVSTPAWSMIDYGFLVTRLADGSSIEPLYDGSAENRKQVFERNEVVEVASTLDLSGVQAIGEPAESTPSVTETEDFPLLAREIHYTLKEAGEVILVWGINGWQPMIEAVRPAGTLVIDNVMHTPMSRTGEIFVVEIPVPAGSRLDYRFLITETASGSPVQVSEGGGGEGYHDIVNESGITEIRSEISLGVEPGLPSSIIVGIYLLSGILVIVIVGFLFRNR